MERGFSEEGDLFRESIRKFVKREILPRAREIGKLEEVPRDLWKKICEMGLVGMTAPDQYGGQPGHSHILGIGAEEIGKGEGLSMIMKSFDLMRVLVALISIGAAEAVLEETIGYVKERAAFGRPIGAFEGVSFKIAEGKTLLEAARALCYRALSLRDRGAKHTKEAAMCKWWATKVAVEVIHDALVLHGHFGYSSEALIEQRLRDVIGNQLADGSPEAMKLILVRELLGKEFLPYQ